MENTEINGQIYKIGTLDAKRQFHVARRLMPVQGALAAAAPAMIKAHAAGDADGASVQIMMSAVGEVLAQMKEADVDYILDTCLSVVSRQQGDRFARIWVNGTPAFIDIDMQVMMRLTIDVIKGSLGGFFGMASDATPSPQS